MDNSMIMTLHDASQLRKIATILDVLNNNELQELTLHDASQLRKIATILDVLNNNELQDTVFRGEIRVVFDAEELDMGVITNRHGDVWDYFAAKPWCD